MKADLKKYYDDFKVLVDKIEAPDATGKQLNFESALLKICELLSELRTGKSKVAFIGNGGSAGIASHMASDFLKNGRVRTLALTDPSLLTCISNDLGYEHVYEFPIEKLADKGDVLFAISSSGESKNIINAVKAAKMNGMIVITLSGFKQNNALRAMGDHNFYVPSMSYGHVESAHQLICQSIVDTLMAN